MRSQWNIDVEKGPQTSTDSIHIPPESKGSPRRPLSTDTKAPLTSSSPGEGSHPLNYGDRLVSNYLAPRPHPKFDNMNYDDTIIPGGRFRCLNIARIQHDLLRLQHELTKPGGGTEENFARLSSLLHEHATAVRDLDFMDNSLVRINYNPCHMERLISQYPELPWNKSTAPHRLALLREIEIKPRDLIASIRSLLPRSWCWSKTERDLRPEVYKLDLRGVPGFAPKGPSLTVTIVAGTIVSLASSVWIIVPTIIMSFQGGRTKSLVTVAVAVTLFGFFLLVGVRTKISETFLATATYAAILVVFVGSTSSTYS